MCDMARGRHSYPKVMVPLRLWLEGNTVNLYVIQAMPKVREATVAKHTPGRVILNDRSFFLPYLLCNLFLGSSRAAAVENFSLES
jgi:hypothetical protein